MNKIFHAVMAFLTGGQSDFAFPLSHLWHGINVAPPLYLIAFTGAVLAAYFFGVVCWQLFRRKPTIIAVLLCCLSATAAYAASSTLANLSAGSAISDTDLFYCVQGGADFKCTGLQLRTYVAANVVTSIATGCQATGGTITTTGTISTQFLDSANSPSSSGGYTVQASDACTNLVLESGYSGTLTIPVATTNGFTNGNYFTVTNESGVNVPITITTSTLGGFSAFNLGPGARISFNSDGTNYHWTGGMGSVSFQTGSNTGNTLTPYNGYFVCTAACTVTPPVPAPGYQFCVMNDDNVGTVITLGALGSSSYYENTARTAYGTAGTGTLSSGGAKADMACIVGRDSTHYLTPTYVGTWTAS